MVSDFPMFACPHLVTSAQDLYGAHSLLAAAIGDLMLRPRILSLEGGAETRLLTNTGTSSSWHLPLVETLASVCSGLTTPADRECSCRQKQSMSDTWSMTLRRRSRGTPHISDSRCCPSTLLPSRMSPEGRCGYF